MLLVTPYLTQSNTCRERNMPLLANFTFITSMIKYQRTVTHTSISKNHSRHPILPSFDKFKSELLPYCPCISGSPECLEDNRGLKQVHLQSIQYSKKVS